jgi:hypothetical protein
MTTITESSLFQPPVEKCGSHEGLFEISMYCSECRRPVCVECVLDCELESGMCWRCLDWTPNGKAKKRELGAGAARTERRRRRLQGVSS